MLHFCSFTLQFRSFEFQLDEIKVYERIRPVVQISGLCLLSLAAQAARSRYN